MFTRCMRDARALCEFWEKKVHAYEDFWNSTGGESSITKFRSDKQTVYTVSWLNKRLILLEMRTSLHTMPSVFSEDKPCHVPTSWLLYL